MKTAILLATVLPVALLVGCAAPKSQSTSAPAMQQSAGTTDAAITTKVQSALAADADLAATKIAVDTAAGTVTLKGEIKSMMLRKKVEALVNGVSGVKAIDNRLVITG
ncbi:MAG: BON domain-containing protein [Pseudomonadota bacterium]